MKRSDSSLMQRDASRVPKSQTGSTPRTSTSSRTSIRTNTNSRTFVAFYSIHGRAMDSGADRGRAGREACLVRLWRARACWPRARGQRSWPACASWRIEAIPLLLQPSSTSRAVSQSLASKPRLVVKSDLGFLVFAIGSGSFWRGFRFIRGHMHSLGDGSLAVVRLTPDLARRQRCGLADTNVPAGIRHGRTPRRQLGGELRWGRSAR